MANMSANVLREQKFEQMLKHNERAMQIEIEADEKKRAEQNKSNIRMKTWKKLTQLQSEAREYKWYERESGWEEKRNVSIF